MTKLIAFNELMKQNLPRYTEVTLLSAMEGAGKLVEDEELAEARKKKDSVLLQQEFHNRTSD